VIARFGENSGASRKPAFYACFRQACRAGVLTSIWNFDCRHRENRTQRPGNLRRKPIGRSGKNYMPYHVLALTMAQVRQGGLEFQRQLSPVVRELKDVKVYSASPFDLDERRRLKDRFGGDVVYFFNDAAQQECARLGLDLTFKAEIPDTELPRRRTVVVGIPD
jgi:hypothetical protein